MNVFLVARRWHDHAYHVTSWDLKMAAKQIGFANL